ncbi:MAG: glycosyltransferase family 4 protein [Dysgonomonas sp.]|nr:glycosyltransferase family 4 protein [Dysgonomonas sp.]
MKVVYCLIDSSGTGGMERSICCKANYLADVAGYNVTILTTDRKGKANFYEYSSKIQFIDLGINYYELEYLSFFDRISLQLEKRKKHKEELNNILLKLRPDVVVSTGTHELTLLYNIKDGSKKILEFHFCKPYKKIEYSQYPVYSLKRLFALAAEWRRQQFAKKYDALVVLTKEDKKRWKNIAHIEVIPNMVSFYPERINKSDNKRIISVGRLSYEKGYPFLIEAWAKVAKKYSDWTLSVYGEGDEKHELVKMISRKGVRNSMSIHPFEKDIQKEYEASSVYVMSSLYEGFGLVLTEAMAYGLPCISFDCPSGPSEIITNGEDGIIVEYKNIDKLAEAIIFLIEDKTLRKEMGENARENVKRFLPEKIMPRWISLFEQITGLSNY